MNKNTDLRTNVMLLTTCIAGCLSGGCTPDGGSGQAGQAQFKNVVVIVGDDHAYTALGAYGNERIRTPNLDALAKEGIRFTNAYSSSPICSASRQSLLTGKYAHQTGVSLLFTPFNDSRNETLAEKLKSEGFATALIGKAHFNSFIWWSLYDGNLPKFGFDTLIDRAEHRRWLEKNPPPPLPADIRTFDDPSDLPEHIRRMNAETLPRPIDDAHSQGTFLANSAIDFLQRNRDGRFMIWLAFHEPHAPFAFPVEFAGKYKAEEMVLPENSDEDDRWIPERFRGFTDLQKKGVIASYYTSVEYMDKNTGLVLDALEKEGLADETLVVYLGDQGYLLYHHKRFEKHTMWNESVKAPLIFRGKGIPGNLASDAIVEFTDVAPTICSLLGVSPMEEASGKAIDGLVGGAINGREYAFSEHLEDNMAMVATKRWKYVFTTGKLDLGLGYSTGYGPSGIHERLYDLRNDPLEHENLAYRDEHRTTVDSLRNLMLDHFLENHPDAASVPRTLNLTGKLVWFCEPRDVGAIYGGQPLRTFYFED